MRRATRFFLLLLSFALLLGGCSKQETAITTPDDAKDKKIGVMTGSIGETLAHKRFPKADIKSFDDVMDSLTALKSKQIDAILTMYPTAVQIVKKNPDLHILKENLQNEDTAVAVKREKTQLLSDVDRIITALRNEGTLADMERRWLKTDLSPYEEKEIALPKKGEPLKIGVSATREPLSFVDKNGRITGLDGELARRIAAKMKRPVEFYNMKFMALIPALQSGKVDLIISGINATPERRKSVSFSQTYFANAQIMLVRKPEGAAATPANSQPVSPELRALQETAGKRIGVMTGSTGEVAATARFTKGVVKRFDDLTDSIAALEAGQVDAAGCSQSTAYLLKRNYRDLRVLPDVIRSEDIGMAMRKDNQALLDDVNRIIKEFKADGTLAAMKKRWLREDGSAYEEVHIAPSKTGKPLRVGASVMMEPFVFMDGKGQVIGHDSELVQRIGAKLKRPVEFHNMKFAALLPALQAGKIDMIVSNMTITEERRKAVNFSEPYYEDIQVLLVKDKAGAQGTAASNAAPTGTTHLKLNELNGMRIGVLTGSAGDNAARKHFPKASFHDLNSSADAALAVKTHKIDAFVYDKSVLLTVAEKNPDLLILPTPVDKLAVAAAIKKENTKFLKDFNRVMASLKKDGTLKRLREKWVDSKDPGARVMPPESKTTTNGVIRMGTNAIIEPFSYQANGQLAGLDIELARLIGTRLGKRVEILDMQFEALIPALQAGKIDFAMSNFNVTDERKKLVNFSLPYIENDISALVRRNETASAGTSAAATPGTLKLSKPEDLADKRIGVLLGSEQDRYAMRHFPKATILQYKTPSDLILAVKSGKVDASLYIQETMAEVMRTDKELGFVGGSLYPIPIAMGFRKGNDALRKQFNDFLKQIKHNGVYDDMVKRWTKDGSTTMPSIPNPGNKGRLVVATVSDKGMPFAMIKDNELIGFDTELCYRFGAYLGKKVKFEDMEFGSLIASVSAGKVDMVASTLMVTAERKKQIDFSDVYYEMGSSAFALTKNIASAETPTTAKPVAPSFFSNLADSFHNNIMLEKRYLLIWDGLKVTFLIAILSSLLGTLIGALVCFMRMSKKKAMNIPAKIFISVMRGTPVLVLLMLIFYVVFASIDINPVLVAVIAFGLNFGAYTSEMFRAGIESIDKGQTEAGIAMGFTKTNTFLHIVLPQAVRQILPVYKGEFISLVKMTSIVGYIAVQDLTKASDIIRSRTFDAFFPLFMVAILYFLISWLLTQSLEYLERKTDPKRKRTQGGKA